MSGKSAEKIYSAAEISMKEFAENHLRKDEVREEALFFTLRVSEIFRKVRARRITEADAFKQIQKLSLKCDELTGYSIKTAPKVKELNVFEIIFLESECKVDVKKIKELVGDIIHLPKALQSKNDTKKSVVRVSSAIFEKTIRPLVEISDLAYTIKADRVRAGIFMRLPISDIGGLSPAQCCLNADKEAIDKVRDLLLD